MTDLARLTFIGMISLADDQGRGRAAVAFIKARLHAYSSVSETKIKAALDEIADAKVARFYEVAGLSYYCLPGWAEHQRIDRPSQSTIPNPPPFVEHSSNDRRGLAEGSSLEGKGREGKGKDVSLEPGKAPASKPPAGNVQNGPKAGETAQGLVVYPVVGGKGGSGASWAFLDDFCKELSVAFPGVDVLGEAKKARAWVVANPERRKTPGGMPRFLFSWMERSQNSGRGARAGSLPPQVRAAQVSMVERLKRELERKN